MLTAATIAMLLGSATGSLAASGVSTFNDYSSQSGVACSGYSASNSQGTNIYAAAMADLSPLWTGSKCSGSINSSNCNGSGGCINCTGPSCSGEEVCGSCFTVKCTGSLDGETSGSCSGNTITVKIVDACPATHPENYCKLSQFGGNVPANQCCEASGTNALDIATTARSALSSFQGNLNIDIEGPVACSGSTTTTTSHATTTTSTASGGGGTQALYGQCGGIGWTGPTTCASPYTCEVQNAYYSQCL